MSSVAKFISSSNFCFEKVTETDENAETSIILEQDISALLLDYHTVFVPNEVEEFAHEGIAEILEITVGTSKS